MSEHHRNRLRYGQGIFCLECGKRSDTCDTYCSPCAERLKEESRERSQRCKDAYENKLRLEESRRDEVAAKQVERIFGDMRLQRGLEAEPAPYGTAIDFSELRIYKVRNNASS